MRNEVSMDEQGNELQNLIETEIPEGRQNLETSYTNLERVAAYCEANYMQASDKKAAFEETKRYTVQSLASVAYQINTLACSLLQMLDLQTEKIDDMDSQVNNIAQIVDIHKEKVARREIGVLTTNKTTQRQHKIIAPVQQEKPQRYVRKAIDYSILDELVKLPNVNRMAGPPSLMRTHSNVSGDSSGSAASVPRFQPDLDMFPRGGTIPKTSITKDYRVPVTATPTPTPPVSQHDYMMTERYSMAPNPMLQRASLASGGSMMANYREVNVTPRQQSLDQQTYATHQMPLPPPQLSQLGDYFGGATAEDLLPPPPSPGDMRYSVQHSPPLPPPPMEEGFMSADSAIIPEMPQYGTYMGRRDTNLPDWVPRNFIEKVVAIYDYDAEKPDELSFQENAVIYVLRKNDDGWFEGVSDAVTGLFPGNYVESCL